MRVNHLNQQRTLNGGDVSLYHQNDCLVGGKPPRNDPTFQELNTL